MKIWLALLLWAAVQAPWVKVEPLGGRFSVNMPAKPTVSHAKNSTPLGEVHTSIFTSTQSWGSYTVTYSDLPGAAVTFARGRVIDDTRAELLKDAAAAMVSYSDSSRFGGGKELSYKNAQLQGWSEIYILGSRLFVADVKVKSGTSKARLVNPFFASLKLL